MAESAKPSEPVPIGSPAAPSGPPRIVPLPEDAPPPPKRTHGHRGADVKDTVAEMAAKAHEISLEAGSKMAAAMKDVVNAAAGLSGFVMESARDLVQFMVRRGQMTQDEADKLIMQVEEHQPKRKPAAPAASTPASKPKSAHAPAPTPPRPTAARPVSTRHAPSKPAPKGPVRVAPARKATVKATPGKPAAKGKTAVKKAAKPTRSPVKSAPKKTAGKTKPAQKKPAAKKPAAKKPAAKKPAAKKSGAKKPSPKKTAKARRR